MKAGGRSGCSGLNRSYILLFFVMILMVFSALSFLPGSLASPDELYGVVIDVIDGEDRKSVV